MTRLLEICCADAESVNAAINGGADRIELCSALGEGGITPSKGLIDYACRVSPIPVNILIRPRSGDFIYNSDEAEIMLDDIAYAAQAGASGVVIGALLCDGSIDYNLCKRLVNCAKSYGLTVTFHRAFDLCRDPEEALREIGRLGCDRLLTSGQAASAIAGHVLIKEMVEKSQGHPVILAGAGVTYDNAADIIKLTNASELHASAKMNRASAMIYRNTDATMGKQDNDEYMRTVTSEHLVNQLATIIHSIP